MDEFDEYERYSANAEIRQLTLELMKIAIRTKKSFEEVAKEYIRNVYYLSELLQEVDKALKRDKNEEKFKKSYRHY